MADINLGVGGANSAVAGGYEIDNSVKLEPDNTEMLYTGSLTAGNRRTWTISMWVKRTELSYESAFMYSQGTYGNIRFFTDDKIVIENHNLYLITNRVFRDTSAWYHVVWVNDSTQSTASNRSKLYINGVQETSFSTETYMSQNEEGNVNSTSGTYIGRRSNEVKHFAGYIADVYKVDGQALAPTDFGEFDEDSGIWKPKAYTGGSYSTQGFHLDFSDSSDLGNDSSGENNDFLLQNITSADQATDTPTNNFCTMNVLKGGINLSGTVYNRLPLMTEGATVVGNNSNNYTFAEATMGVTSGKWYWEMKPTVDANTLVSGAGIATNTNGGFSSTSGVGNFFYHYDGNRYVNGAATGYGAAWTTNDIIGFAYDADSWTLTCYINNSSQGNLLASQADLSAEFVIPYMYSYGTHTYQWNFGGYHANSLSSPASDANGYGTFEYAPPSGYYALCGKNLAEYGGTA